MAKWTQRIEDNGTMLVREKLTGRLRFVQRTSENNEVVDDDYGIRLRTVTKSILQQEWIGTRTYMLTRSVPENFVEWRDVPTETEEG